MTPTVSIKSLHLEYQLWMRELVFYKEEIKIFEDHLIDLVRKNTSPEFKVQVEHFQNQFILEKEVIDHLKHDLHVSELQLAAFSHGLSGDAIENVRMDNHSRIRDRIFTFRKIYRELKDDFRQFESKWS